MTTNIERNPGGPDWMDAVLALKSRAEAEAFFGRPEGLPTLVSNRLRKLAPLPAAEAQRLFLKRFSDLAAGL